VGFFFDVNRATKKEKIRPKRVSSGVIFSIFMPGNGKEVHSCRMLFSQQREKQVDLCRNFLPDV
jgi:hypothetical protein